MVIFILIYFKIIKNNNNNNNNNNNKIKPPQEMGDPNQEETEETMEKANNLNIKDMNNKVLIIIFIF